jgi:predicted ATPase/DNA-binding CsgD family transcriptional regulator
VPTAYESKRWLHNAFRLLPVEPQCAVGAIREYRAAVSTGVKLTRRAQEVADLVALGLTNREIAKRLFLSERTAEWHLEQIFNRLGFTSRSQVAAWVGRTQVDAAVPVPRRRPRGNLPAQLTTFVGRDRELTSLFDLVATNRLVTVTGPGGSGKTRLALRLAEELLADIPDGIWLCDLAPVAEPSLVDDAVARAIGANRTAKDRLAAARNVLRERAVLLVVDNCEHVLAASAAVIQDLLAACPGLRIVATSRTPLDLIGEAVFALRPLGPDEAFELFKDRAEAAAHDFRVDATNSKSVAAICRRLDGLPLAIELVVPRLRVQSADQLSATALDPAWQVHSDQRHGSLRAIADWSYRLLASSERTLFRRLGVFAGWFDADDAAALAPTDAASMPVLLSSLVEHSMLVQELTPTGTRYRLLETLRAFTLERLEDAEELEAARLSHAHRMVWLVERLDWVKHDGPLLRPRSAGWTDDVRSALSILLEADPRQATWLSATMMWTWIWNGRAAEGLHWNDLVLAADPDPSPEQSWSFFARAALLSELRRKGEAAPWFAKAQAIRRNALHRIQLMLSAAMLQDRLKHHHAAMRLRQEAIEASTADGDEWALARALNHSAMSMLFLDRPAEAVDFAQRSIEVCRRADPPRLPYVMDTLAQAHAILGELDLAKESWLGALELGRDTGWGWARSTPSCLFGLAYVAGERGRKATALRLHYCAEKLGADDDAVRGSLEANGSYREPLAPREAALVGYLEAELGRKTSSRLYAESETLTPQMAIELAIAEG